MVCKALVALCIFTAGTWRGPRKSQARRGVGVTSTRVPFAEAETRKSVPLEGGASAGVRAGVRALRFGVTVRAPLAVLKGRK